MLKKKLFHVTVGLCLGVVAGWILFPPCDPCSEVRGTDDTSLDSDVLGVNFKYGDSAKSASKVAGLPIPDDSRDWYYCIAGLKGVTEFIAFSVPIEQLWPTVEMITQKKKNDFLPSDYFKGPESFGDKYRTLLFNVSQHRLISCSFDLNGLWAICAVNEAESRILVNIMSRD